MVNGKAHEIQIAAWTGMVGNFDHRLWDFGWNRPSKILPGFIKRDNIAWFASHRHLVSGENDSYRFVYLFKYGLPVNSGDTVTLPNNAKIKIFAMTAGDGSTQIAPMQPLYDDFSGRKGFITPKNWVDKFTNKEPTTITKEKAPSFTALKLQSPSTKDLLDSSNPIGAKVSYMNSKIHAGAGSRGKFLPRLNDGFFAENSDQPRRCSWFDNNEGQILIDLKESREVESLLTYSRHSSNRAPQNYILLATNQSSPDLDHLDPEQWKNLGWISTEGLGDGGVHGVHVKLENPKRLVSSYVFLVLV